MKLPDLSALMHVGYLRYIHSVHEPVERRGPDTLVRYLIPVVERWRAAWLSRRKLAALRAKPFYYYLLARTKYYDQIVRDAVVAGVKQIVIIGCGSDTRAYRFRPILSSGDVRVLECDQPEAIYAKERLTVRWQPAEHVEYMPIDLNDPDWPKLERWLGGRTGPTTLVMMEGVSAYVDDAAFSQFLAFLARSVSAGSEVAYDFKVRGSNDELGRAGRTIKPFRLLLNADAVAAFHKERGLRVTHMESSAELNGRLLPGLVQQPASLFTEDCLLRLNVE